MAKRYQVPEFKDLVMLRLLRWVRDIRFFFYPALKEAFETTPPGCALRLLKAEDVVYQLDSDYGINITDLDKFEGLPRSMSEIPGTIRERRDAGTVSDMLRALEHTWAHGKADMELFGVLRESFIVQGGLEADWVNMGLLEKRSLA